MTTSITLADALGELQALRNHVYHWNRGGSDLAALKRADEFLAAALASTPQTVNVGGTMLPVIAVRIGPSAPAQPVATTPLSGMAEAWRLSADDCGACGRVHEAYTLRGCADDLERSLSAQAAPKVPVCASDAFWTMADDGLPAHGQLVLCELDDETSSNLGINFGFSVETWDDLNTLAGVVRWLPLNRMPETSKDQAVLDRLAAAPQPPAPSEQRNLPNPGSPEASAMIDSLLAEYHYPANPKNAARAGYEAARRMLQDGIRSTGGEQS